MSTHNAVAVTGPGTIDAIQVPTLTPGVGEVLIKVEYTSLIAFDTYMADLGYNVPSYPLIPGFNASGIVVKVGENIIDLAVGDRVVALCFRSVNSKGAQEYTVQPRFGISKLPDSISLEEAATVPDNLITAFFVLFDKLGLPMPPSFPAQEPPPLASTPFLVYGAGSTSGQYAIQLLRAAGYTKILATASSRHHDYLKSIGATDTFDYNSPNLVADVAKAVGGDGKVPIVMDCIAAQPTLKALADIVSPTGKVAILFPIKKSNTLTVKQLSEFEYLPKDNAPFARTVQLYGVKVFTEFQNSYLRDILAPNIIPSLLKIGVIKPNRLRLIDHGSLKERVIEGMDLLRNNKVSGEKVVIKIGA